MNDLNLKPVYAAVGAILKDQRQDLERQIVELEARLTDVQSAALREGDEALEKELRSYTAEQRAELETRLRNDIDALAKRIEVLDVDAPVAELRASLEEQLQEQKSRLAGLDDERRSSTAEQRSEL